MFQDRREAGQKLSEKLEEKYPRVENGLVLALPRGGVVLGKIIAQKLNLPLDIIVTRKIGAPGNPEYAVAAVSDHEIIISPRENPNPEYLEQEASNQRREIRRREKIFRMSKPSLEIKNKTIFLVDDGLATGLTMEVAIREIRIKKPKAIILAVPVAPPETAKRLVSQVDESLILAIEPNFFAVGQFYKYFPQISDQQVKNLMKD
ncbi:MAG: phosphoribosyltransferase family protein [Patescibacteria group bacterium]